MDIVNFRTQKLTEAVKDEQITKLNTKSSSSNRKSRVLKQPVYFSSLINGFNSKLQRDTAIVKGLNKADENKSQTTPIDTLLKRASLDT